MQLRYNEDFSCQIVMLFLPYSFDKSLAWILRDSAEQASLPSGNSSNRTERAPSIGAQQMSSMGLAVSPSVASKKVAPLALCLCKDRATFRVSPNSELFIYRCIAMPVSEDVAVEI